MVPIEKIELSSGEIKYPYGSVYDGLKPFVMQNLRQTVVLTGPNGSGKTRLLNLLAAFLKDRDKCDCKNFSINPDDGGKYTVSDFSHYDVPLQQPSDFPYFVVAGTADRLKKAEFANIDKEALLYIQCIAWHHENEFKKFNNLLKEIIGERIDDNAGKLTFFGLEFNNMRLSPGQQYLLRLCVTLFCNQKTIDLPDKRVLLLDEPEMHLHPGVLLKIVSKILAIFAETQIWIATHSISLLSIFDTADIWYMDKGKPKQMNSNSFEVLQGLLEESDHKAGYREKLEYFIQLPNIFALCEFAKESLKDAVSLSLKARMDGDKDPQIKLAETSIKEFDFSPEKEKEKIKKIKLIDFGAGKGRFFESLSKEDAEEYDYYAYNNANKTSGEDKDRCINIMSGRLGKDEAREKYFDNIKDLHDKMKGQADCVLLMNVLHEIDPTSWREVLKEEIRPLLAPGGLLIIIEVEELKRGENASSCGFLVLTEGASKILFGNNVRIIRQSSDDVKRGTISFIIAPEQLETVCLANIIKCVEFIKNEAMEKITEIRNETDSRENLSRKGIRHAFWLHQYANVSIALDSLKKE